MDDMNERWKDIIGYEGLYKVSNFGRIKTVSRVRVNGRAVIKSKSIFRKTHISKEGYAHLTLTKDNNLKNHMVHRLVSIHFIKNPDGKEDVNHIDGNKLNNHVSNLEWCTQKENSQHALKNKLFKPKIKISNDTVNRIRKDSNKMSAWDISKKYAVSHAHVKKIINFEIRVY